MAAPRNPGFALEVAGSGFVPGAKVVWDGTPRAATFVSSTRLDLLVTAADVADGRSVTVNVAKPEPAQGPSNTMTFTVAPLSSSIFADGFETGGTTKWSSKVP